MKSKIKLITLVLTLILSSSAIGYWVRAQTELSFTTVIENGSMVETVSYIIFTDGSSYYAKNGTTGAIDFSGTVFSTVIQAAINARPSLGGTILLKQGVYTITAQITLLNGTWLVGEGWNIGSNYAAFPNMGTVLKISGNIIGIYANSKSAIKLSNFLIDGSNYGLPVVSGKHNIALDTCSDAIVERIDSLNSKDAGIYLTHCIECRIENCEAKTCSGSGIFFNASYDSHLTGGLSGSNQEDGIYVKDCSATEISGINCFTNTKHGIAIENSYAIRLINDRCDENVLEGILVYKSISSSVYGDYNLIMGCALISNSHSSPGSYAAIKISGDAGEHEASYNTVVGCHMFDLGGSFQAIGVYLDAYTQYNIVTDCVPVGMINYPIYNIGSNNIVTHNQVYVTENSGTQTIANGETVNHGLSGTPTSVIVTARTLVYDGNVTVVGVTARGGSTFTVGAYWTNGTAISTDAIIIDWYAEYKP